MPSTAVVRREIGKIGLLREVLAATVLLAGAAAVAVGTDLLGFKLYENLAVLGAAATLAWLVDGTAQRYIGAGTVALAIGGGLTLGTRLHIPGYEHLVVFGFVGVALLLVSYINPKAVRGSAALFVLIAITVAVEEYLGSYNAGWELAGILAFWSLLEYGRISRSRSSETAGVVAARGRAPVAASAPVSAAPIEPEQQGMQEIEDERAGERVRQ